MSGDKTSLSTEVQQGDQPLQTANKQINNQDIKHDDLAAASTPETSVAQALDSDVSKPAATAVSTNEPSQIPDSDANNQANDIVTHGSPKSSTTTVLTSNQDSNSADQTNMQATNQSTQTAPTDLKTNKDDQKNPLPTVEPSTTQIRDSDANAIATHDSPKSSTTTVLTSNQDSNTADQTHMQATNQSTQTAPTDLQTNKDDQKNPLPTVEPSTTQIRDSDANTIATHDSPKSSTTTVLTSNQDSNTANQTNMQATNQSTQTAPTDLQTNKDDQKNPLPTVEPSTTQIPDSDANATATHDSPKSSTTTVLTSNQDSNTADQTHMQATNQSTQTAPTDLQTNKDDQKNPLPTVEPSTTQIHDSDANAIATHDSPKSSTVMDPTSNQDTNSDTKQSTNDQSDQTTSNDPQTSTGDHVNPLPTAESSTSQNPDPTSNKDSNLVDQTSSSKADTDTKQATTDTDTKPATDQSTETASTESQNDKEKSPPSDVTPIEERKHLLTLIDQEIKFVKDACPRLEKHQKRINDEAENATKVYEKLKVEPCELKELKDLKRIVTKLKLQIPARYRRYDKSEKQKNQQSPVDNKDISSKLQKKLPRLHDKVFEENAFCKAIQLRFNELRCELKLCLLCFSVFPEKAIISRRAMVYWWIGDGLIIPQEDDFEEGKTAEDYANRLFNELMEMNFIEPDSKVDGRHVANCKMHPMVRAALVMIADEVNFLDFDRYGDPKDFGKFDEIESPEDLPSFHPLGDPREFFDFFNEDRKSILDPIELSDSIGNAYQFAALDLSLAPVDGDGNPNDDSDKTPKPKPIPKLVDRDGKPIDISKKYYFYRRKMITTKSFKMCLMGSGLSKGITWEKLHMLFNVKDNILEFKPEWLLRMKNINVLFLGRWQSSAAHHIEVDDDEFDFEKSLDYMGHVRFFSLQGVSSVSKLPNSISKFKTLVILDLRACHNLEVIPKTIGSLKFLTHLDISECYLLKEIPKEISFLESLQVLKGFVVVDSPGKDVCTLQDLRKLENLRKLSIYIHMKNFPQDDHLDALQKIETLRKLTILWGGQDSKDKQTESEDKQIDSKDKQIDSKDKPSESKDRQLESKDKPLESKDKPSESKVKPIKSKDKRIESKDKQIESKDKPIESKDKPSESRDKQIESRDKPSESKDKPSESKDKRNESTGKQIESKGKQIDLKQDVANKKKQNGLASKVMKLLHKKKQVDGFRRMNAFSDSTLGVQLEKLDLKCFTQSDTHNWLTPGSFKGLKKLYIRGGSCFDLGQYQDSLQLDDSSVVQKETWNVTTLRLKYLDELKMEWRELQNLFPKLTSLEKVKCPKLTLFPCDENGVWINKGSTTTARK